MLSLSLVLPLVSRSMWAAEDLLRPTSENCVSLTPGQGEAFGDTDRYIGTLKELMPHGLDITQSEQYPCSQAGKMLPGSKYDSTSSAQFHYSWPSCNHSITQRLPIQKVISHNNIVHR